MAGFFGLFDYNKPGPGVPKDAPPKSPFIVFFGVLQRKFWNLIKVNMMFLAFNLPALIIGMYIMLTFFYNADALAAGTDDILRGDVIEKFAYLTLLMCIPMVTVGPARAGFTYIMRNYSREEHAFLWGDFKDAAKKNMKQSLIVGTINFLATFLLLFSIRAYWLLIQSGGLPDLLGTAGMTVMVMVFVIFACMNIYIYPMMVTFDLTIKQLYKNSLIFAIIKIIPNLGILLLCTLLILLSFIFNYIIGIILFIFLTYSLIGLLTNFYAYPKLKKYMIDPIEEEDEEDDEEEEDEEEDDEDDTDDEKSEGRKENESSGVEDSENDNNNEDDDDIKRYF